MTLFIAISHEVYKKGERERGGEGKKHLNCFIM